jgi:hypothetical protein
MQTPLIRAFHPIRLHGPRFVLPLACIVAAVPSCRQVPLPAAGPPNEIGVIGPLEAADPRLESMRGLLEREVRMIQGEPAYRLELIPTGARRNWRAHLLLVDLRDPSDSELAKVVLTGEERRTIAAMPAAHRIFRDVWAAGQVVLLVHAHDPDALRRHIKMEGEEILDLLTQRLIEALRDGLFAGGQEEEVEESISRKHRFHIRVPIGYLEEEVSAGVVLKRIVPEEPKRWLLVHYGSKEDAPGSTDDWLALRDSLLSADRSGDRVLRERSVARPSLFQGHPCVLLEGIWQNEEYLIGGPFLSYGFVRGERYYLIDLSVYHPPAPKLPALRQLMAIAETFEA